MEDFYKEVELEARINLDKTEIRNEYEGAKIEHIDAVNRLAEAKEYLEFAEDNLQNTKGAMDEAGLL